MDLIEKMSDKPWEWEALSNHPNVSLEFMEKHMDKPWTWKSICFNPNITIEFIERHSGNEKAMKEMNWMMISKNIKLTRDMMRQYDYYPWNWVGISANPTITLDFIEVYSDQIAWNMLSQNTFSKQ